MRTQRELKGQKRYKLAVERQEREAAENVESMWEAVFLLGRGAKKVRGTRFSVFCSCENCGESHKKKEGWGRKQLFP